MKDRVRVYSGAPWESQVGYCRAVRVAEQVAITGTAAVGDDGGIVGIGDAYRQTQRCIEIIANALRAAGGGLEHVIRTRMFVTDIGRWAEIGKAHREAFGDHPPATTMVEVSRLIDPDMLVEIEADAIVETDGN